VTPEETGAGIVVGIRENTAFVLTAYHVVKNDSQIGVTFFAKRDIEVKQANVFKFYEELDIAVIKVTSNQLNAAFDHMPNLHIGAVPKVGDKLSTIGHPADLEWLFEKDAYSYAQLGYLNDFRKFLYSSQALQRGTSGGPVLDQSAALVGLVSERGPSGHSVAIAIDAALAVLNSWGVPTSKLITLPKPSNPNFVVEVYEGSRTNLRKGVFVTLKNLVDDDTQQQQTEASGLARFHVEDGSLCQVSLMTERARQLMTTILAADHNFRLPYVKSVDISQIPSEQWALAKPSSTTPWFTDFAGVATQSKTDLINSLWPFSTIGNTAFKTEHLPWGVPKAEKIIFRRGYVLGYDSKKLIPKWVAYRINRSSDYTRQEFASDPDISSEEQARLEDYRGSGYDRGQLVSPPEVAGYGEDAVIEAYYLTTVAPQIPALKRVGWVQLVRHIRDLTQNSVLRGRVWIIAGPIFTSRDGKINYAVIGQRKVAIPSAFFRIVITMDQDKKITAFGFLVRNDAAYLMEKNLTLIDPSKPPFMAYLTSIDSIEEATGLDFFSDLDKDTQERLERTVPTSFP